MAQRRMFSLKIVDTDAFLDMPQSSRLFYYDLAMRADDDGFVSNPKKIMRMTGASEDDLKVLIGKKFILPFASGVCVIKHWKIHNYIQKDRYTPTTYLDEKSVLGEKDNGVYTLDTKCIQNGNTGKVRIGKSKRKNKLPDKPAGSSKNKKEDKPKNKIDDDTPFTLDEYVDSMLKSPQRHIQILGNYAHEIKPNFKTKGQWYAFTQRNVRAARLLTPYTDDQIADGFERIRENMKTEKNPKGYLTRWTLETLSNFLHK